MRNAAVIIILACTSAAIALYVLSTADSEQAPQGEAHIESEPGSIEPDASLSNIDSIPRVDSENPPEDLSARREESNADESAGSVSDSSFTDDSELSNAPETVSQQIYNRFHRDRMKFIREMGELADRQGKDPLWGKESETALRAMILEHFGDRSPFFNLECYGTICTLDTSASGGQLLTLNRLLDEFVQSNDEFLKNNFVQKVGDGYYVGFLFRDTFVFSDLK